MKVIVGLGNPEEKYGKTRHNLGFLVVEEFAKKLDSGEWQMEEKFKSEIIKTGDLILVKPQTYMNNSGLAVREVVDFFKISPEEVIIIYDELDLPLGKIKVRRSGSAAGHHGVESVLKHLNTDHFIRVRLGIGNLRTKSSEHKHAHVDTNKFVLEPFMHSEKSKVKHMVKQSLKAIELLLEKGLEEAQNQFN